MSFSSLTLCRAVEGMVKEALNPSHPLPPHHINKDLEEPSDSHFSAEIIAINSSLKLI